MVAPQPQPRASMEHWLQSIQTQMASLREQLVGRNPLVVAHSSGVPWEPAGMDGGVLRLRFFGEPLRVLLPEYSVTSLAGDPVSPMVEALVITYLVRSGGVRRAGEWIAFRELPDGMFYHRAFDNYTGQKLASVFGANLEAFKQGAEAAGGSPLSAIGDAAYEFRVMPRLWVAATYWLGDAEDNVPAQARVLFDRTDAHYMSSDGLAIIGSQLVRRVIAAAAES